MNIKNNDNKIDFYKWVNKKVVEKLRKKHFENTDFKILVLYDFVSDYFDIMENKVRIGVNKITNKKIQTLTKKLQSVINNDTFNIIDMRLTLKFIKNDTQLELLFKFMNNMLSNNGFIIGFININEGTLQYLKSILINSTLYIKHTISLNEYVNQFKKDYTLETQDFSKENIVIIEKKLKN
jgi:hypothetical protein